MYGAPHCGQHRLMRSKPATICHLRLSMLPIRKSRRQRHSTALGEGFHRHALVCARKDCDTTPGYQTLAGAGE